MRRAPNRQGGVSVPPSHRDIGWLCNCVPLCDRRYLLINAINRASMGTRACMRLIDRHNLSRFFLFFCTCCWCCMQQSTSVRGRTRFTAARRDVSNWARKTARSIDDACRRITNTDLGTTRDNWKRSTCAGVLDTHIRLTPFGNHDKPPIDCLVIHFVSKQWMPENIIIFIFMP